MVRSWVGTDKARRENVEGERSRCGPADSCKVDASEEVDGRGEDEGDVESAGYIRGRRHKREGDSAFDRWAGGQREESRPGPEACRPRAPSHSPEVTASADTQHRSARRLCRRSVARPPDVPPDPGQGKDPRNARGASTASTVFPMRPVRHTGSSGGRDMVRPTRPEHRLPLCGSGPRGCHRTRHRVAAHFRITPACACGRLAAAGAAGRRVTGRASSESSDSGHGQEP